MFIACDREKRGNELPDLHRRGFHSGDVRLRGPANSDKWFVCPSVRLSDRVSMWGVCFWGVGFAL